jgi:adenosylcobinamide kinase/adenosylcobinamide-phosphate guanylyltransferase
MKRKIILITGGQRSGKSSYAERQALALSPSPVYLATARVQDQEFRARVERHQAARGPEWITLEEDKELSRHDLTGRVVVIDCVTLWCSNFFCDLHADVQQSLRAVKDEFDRFTSREAVFFFVSNEIGMGGIAGNELQRKFTDLQGYVNQYLASKADEVVWMVSGLPVVIKK